MTSTLFYILQLVALILVVIGYRNNNRNLLLAAVICVCAGYGIEDVASGFMDGYNRT